MKTYTFELLLTNASYDDEELDAKLFEAGCDDAALIFSNGIAELAFDREAESLEVAVLSAIKDAETTGVIVTQVLPGDLVSVCEIARRIKKSKQYISQLISGSKGSGTFPRPKSQLTKKSYLWSWSEVCEWLYENGKLELDTLEEANFFAVINLALNELNNLKLKSQQEQAVNWLKALHVA